MTNTLVQPELIWFVIGLVFLLLEFSMPGFVLLFFGIGSWTVSLLCLILPISLNTQLLLFMIISVASILLLRQWLQKTFKGVFSSKAAPEDIDQIIGKTVRVTKEIRPGIRGKVEFQGSSWDAEADQIIPPDSMAVITGKENIVLNVTKSIKE